MHFILILATVLISAITLTASDTTITADTAAHPAPVGKSRSVLIVSGMSDLEAKVVEKLTGLLQNDGITVKRIPITQIQTFRPDSFAVTVLMSAVNKTTLNEDVLRYIEGYGNANEKATVIIAKVSGDSWKDRSSIVDAVAEATSKLPPVRIAQKLRNAVLEKLKQNAH